MSTPQDHWQRFFELVVWDELFVAKKKVSDLRKQAEEQFSLAAEGGDPVAAKIAEIRCKTIGQREIPVAQDLYEEKVMALFRAMETLKETLIDTMSRRFLVELNRLDREDPLFQGAMDPSTIAVEAGRKLKTETEGFVGEMPGFGEYIKARADSFHLNDLAKQAFLFMEIATDQDRRQKLAAITKDLIDQHQPAAVEAERRAANLLKNQVEDTLLENYGQAVRGAIQQATEGGAAGTREVASQQDELKLLGGQVLPAVQAAVAAAGIEGENHATA